MKRLLIVDDERIERNGMKMLLNQMNQPFEILEAADGEQACQILSETDIDMMITDIRMPFMSGLELVKQARALKGNFPIAIFSGFGDFAYAQEAINYGVSAYILKPVKPQDFKDTVLRMLEHCRLKEMQEEKKRSNTHYQYKYLLQKYLFTGKTEYIESLTQGGITPADQKDGIERIQNIMLLDTDDHFFEDHGGELIELLQKKLNRKIDYLDLNMSQMLLIFFRDSDEDYPHIAGCIYDFILNQYGVKCYIAVSKTLTQLAEYPKAYQDLEGQMENKFYCSDETIFLYEAKSEFITTERLKTDYQKRMIDSIKRKDIAHLWDNFHKLKLQIRREFIDSQMYVKFIFGQLVKELYEEMESIGSARMIEAVEAIYQAGNFESICKVAEKCIQEFEQKCLQTENGFRSDIDQVKQYIASHMSEDLSIDKLASIVYLSQGYLSYVFKRETGMTLSRYIKMCRMEQAKELLRTTNMKMGQICEELGFSNVSYFCQSFREYCGVSPERYRKGETEEEKTD